jgi:nucleoid DNA-binding protein
MTKSNLIDHVSEVTKATRKDAEVLVDTLLTSITNALAQGE